MQYSFRSFKYRFDTKLRRSYQGLLLVPRGIPKGDPKGFDSCSLRETPQPRRATSPNGLAPVRGQNASRSCRKTTGGAGALRTRSRPGLLKADTAAKQRPSAFASQMSDAESIAPAHRTVSPLRISAGVSFRTCPCP